MSLGNVWDNGKIHMALNNYWEKEYQLFVVRHVGFAKRHQIESIYINLAHIVATTPVNLIFDLREAMYTSDTLEFVFDPVLLRDNISHHNIKNIVVIVPEKHPLKDYVMESYRIADVLYKVQFVNSWDEAAYYLDSELDNSYSIPFSA